MSGRSNILSKLSNRYPKLTDQKVTAAVLEDIQNRENEGYSYEAADGSFDLLVRRHVGSWRPAFELLYYRVHGIGTAGSATDLVEGTVKLRVNGQERLRAIQRLGVEMGLAGHPDADRNLLSRERLHGSCQERSRQHATHRLASIVPACGAPRTEPSPSAKEATST